MTTDRDRGRIALVAAGLLAFAIRAFVVASDRAKAGFGVGLPAPPMTYDQLLPFAIRWGDSFFFYYWPAEQLAHGHGFLGAETLLYGVPVPGASHPPGFIVLLAGFFVLGIHSSTTMRYLLCALGSVTVVLLGVFVRRTIGPRAGIIAAFIAAIYPNLWIPDTMLLSETLMSFGLVVALLGIHTFHRRPTWRPLAVASVGLTIAASARPEHMVLFGAVVLPLVLARRVLPWSRRIGLLALAALFPLAAFVPWTVYNLGRFEKPVIMSTGFGQTFMTGTCDTNFSGDMIGYYSIDCARYHDRNVPEPSPGEPPDQSVRNSYYISSTLRYLSAHRGRIPIVVVAREGRMLGLWHPSQQAGIDSFVEQRGSRTTTTIAQWSFFVLAALSFIGAREWRRRGEPLYPMLAIVVTTMAVAAITFGSTRYRAPIELVVVVLGATAIDLLIDRVRGRRPDTPGPTVSDTTPAEGDEPAGLSPVDPLRRSPSAPAH